MSVLITSTANTCSAAAPPSTLASVESVTPADDRTLTVGVTRGIFGGLVQLCVSFSAPPNSVKGVVQNSELVVEGLQIDTFMAEVETVVAVYQEEAHARLSVPFLPRISVGGKP